jgi:LytS/YehU family sensor histidine kinase
VIFEKVFEYLLLFVEFFLPFTFLRYWQHPIYRYAAWSSWVSALSFLTYFLIARVGLPIPLPTWFTPANLMFIALMLDGILFLFALTLRDRQIVTEKIRLEQQATANELKALRSQMNPHFIFNALNSIKSFTLNNDAERANFYLTKFSKLIRQVLENSRSEKISLKNELETITLYLDMEKLRVGDKFDYEITIDEEVESEFVEIPPMLIQPYIENAIWHGLVHRQDKGLVKITIQQKDNVLIISIEDNGIGQQKAAEIKSKTGANHKSFGMKINAERLGIIKKLYYIDAKITFNDLQNIDKTPAGTRVIVEIPM